jgi:L-cystine transport system ATP-binding protein
MIQLKNIRKKYGENEVLKGIDIDIPTGSVTVILGPSGSGKTTLLRSINFLEPADGGTITLADFSVDVAKATKADIQKLRRRTAMVFQSYNLFANKTALENITEGLIVVKKMEKQEAIEKGMYYLEKVGLADKKDFYAAELSGGQQQRIGIARAMALDPDIILFDEPTSALDPELVGEVLDTIKKAAAESERTMLVVTHEIGFARDVADQIIFMENGVVVEKGTPEELFYAAKELRTREFLARYASYTEYNI